VRRAIGRIGRIVYLQRYVCHVVRAAECRIRAWGDCPIDFERAGSTRVACADEGPPSAAAALGASSKLAPARWTYFFGWTGAGWSADLSLSPLGGGPLGCGGVQARRESCAPEGPWVHVPFISQTSLLTTQASPAFLPLQASEVSGGCPPCALPGPRIGSAPGPPHAGPPGPIPGWPCSGCAIGKPCGPPGPCIPSWQLQW